MATKKKNNKSPLQSVMDFLQKNWIVVIGFIVGYPLLVRFMRMTEAKDKLSEINAQKAELEAVNATPESQLQALNEITTNTGYHEAAKNLSHHLGYVYSWWNPKRWTENDSEAFDTIVNSPCGINIDSKLIDCYYLITSGRNLYNDLRDVLDVEYFNQLTFI